MTKLTSHEMAMLAMDAASSKKAYRPVLLDVAKMTPFMEYMLICHGRSRPQVNAISEGIEERLKAAGKRLGHRERDRDESWILMDFGEVVCHVFLEETREYYSLEKLWGEVKPITAKRKTSRRERP